MGAIVVTAILAIGVYMCIRTKDSDNSYNTNDDSTVASWGTSESEEPLSMSLPRIAGGVPSYRDKVHLAMIRERSENSL